MDLYRRDRIEEDRAIRLWGAAGDALLLHVRGWTPELVAQYEAHLDPLRPDVPRYGVTTAARLLRQSARWRGGGAFAYFTGPEALAWLTSSRTDEVLYGRHAAFWMIEDWASEHIQPLLRHLNPMTALLAYEARISPAEITGPPDEQALAAWQTLASLR